MKIYYAIGAKPLLGTSGQANDHRVFIHEVCVFALTLKIPLISVVYLFE
jgi:hypothetical protein